MTWLVGRRSRWIAALVAVALGVVSAWLVFWSSVFAAKHVLVDGADQVSVEEVRDAAEVPFGSSMVQLPLAAIEQRVEGLDAVAAAEVEREWPNTVRIVVTERRPVAVTESAQGFGLVGSDGAVYTVAPTRPPGLPLLVDVTGDVNQLDSQSSDAPNALSSFTVARSLPRQLRQHVDSIDALSASSLRLTLHDGAVVDWGSATASAQKSAVLLALLRQQASSRQDQSQDALPLHYDVSVPDAPAWSS